jgi:beta-carotene isomerase
VDDCRALLARRTPAEQRAVVLGVLGTLFVAPRGPAAFRRWFAGRPGLSARITPPAFRWLVGPAEVNDSPEGGAAGAGVLIEKCRFLDESGCKGLCVNMCQQPTQQFFTETLGLPLRMCVCVCAGRPAGVRARCARACAARCGAVR